MTINPIALPTVALAVLFFGAGVRLERRFSGSGFRAVLWGVSVMLAIPGILFATYYLHLFDNATWLYNMRALPYSELAASGMGVLAGMVHAKASPEGAAEWLFTTGVFLLMLLAPFVKPVLAPLDPLSLSPACEGEVCLQSTGATCGPASAATLLRSFHLPASERELARESFTYLGGTEVWYLMRALSRRGVDSRVSIQSEGQDSWPTPAIAGVRLRGGFGHFIALLDQTPDSVTLVDPLVGRKTIKRSELRRHYRFTGFYLEVRAPRSQVD